MVYNWECDNVISRGREIKDSEKERERERKKEWKTNEFILIENNIIWTEGKIKILCKM